MEQEVIIRAAKLEEIEEILPIFPKARAFMAATGNEKQWPDYYPAREDVEEDIAKKSGHVMIVDGKIGAYFALRMGLEPTYEKIEDGAWLEDTLIYGTIHRLATDGSVKHCLDMCIEYCWAICSNLRADTHEDNKIVQAGLERNEFERCGIIHLENGSPRIAYQKLPSFLR